MQQSNHDKSILRRIMGTEAKGYNLITRINNFNLSYDDLGEGGVPIIFLHGFPFNKQMWQVQLEFLKVTNRVIACDIRGFGNSKDEESVLSMDLFGDDLIQFLDKLNIDKAIVCGLSMGGYIALNAYKRYPDRFDALILCDTQCVADTLEVKTKRLMLIDEIALNSTENFTEGFVKNVFHKDSLTQKKEIVEELRNVILSNSKHIISMGLRALAKRSETCSVLSKIKIPTLIICGREDLITPLAQSEFMNKSIEGSIFHIVDDAGHVSNLEQAHEFNKHLHDFLK